MTAENILGIVCLVLIIIFQLVMKWCNENVYTKGKYERGRYIKVGGKK